MQKIHFCCLVLHYPANIRLRASTCERKGVQDMRSIPLLPADRFASMLMAVLLSIPGLSSAEFSCPDGTTASCLADGDKICAKGTQCMDETATCLDHFPCGIGESFVCGPEYDAALDAHRETARKHDQLAAENVDLREQRLNLKNCVLNAKRLADAKKCVR